MEIITIAQAKKLLANKQPFFLSQVKSLKDGQVLFIPFSEWFHSSHPAAHTKNWNKRYGLDLWAKTVSDGYLIGKSSSDLR